MTILEPDQSSNIFGRVFYRAGRVIADTILPPTCLACRVPIAGGGGLCPKC